GRCIGRRNGSGPALRRARRRWVDCQRRRCLARDDRARAGPRATCERSPRPRVRRRPAVRRPQLRPRDGNRRPRVQRRVADVARARPRGTAGWQRRGQLSGGGEHLRHLEDARLLPARAVDEAAHPLLRTAADTGRTAAGGEARRGPAGTRRPHGDGDCPDLLPRAPVAGGRDVPACGRVAGPAPASAPRRAATPCNAGCDRDDRPCGFAHTRSLFETKGGRVVSAMKTPIPIYRPTFDEREEAAVAEVLRSGWIGLGPRTEEFEERFAKHVGARFAVGFNSATAALHVALKLLDLQPGDEVLVPTLTFVATAMVAAYDRTVPVLCDIEREFLCLDVADARARPTDRTRAVMPVLYAGHVMPDVDVGVPAVYDCAHAVGSGFDASGKTCCWSFHAVKNVTTGDGGMLTTDDEDFYRRAMRLRWLG